MDRTIGKENELMLSTKLLKKTKGSLNSNKVLEWTVDIRFKKFFKKGVSPPSLSLYIYIYMYIYIYIYRFWCHWDVQGVSENYIIS